MSKDIINKYFPYYYCTEIRELLKIAVSTAKSMHHSKFSIEHIILGYMKFCEETNSSNPNAINYTSLSWFVPSSEYQEKAHTLKTIPTTGNFEVHSDVCQLSRYYKVIFGKYRLELSMENFYLLILGLNQTKIFQSKYYLPQKDKIDISHLTPFSDYFFVAIDELDSVISYDVYTVLKQIVETESIDVTTTKIALSNSNNYYFSSPLKIDYTTDITYNAREKKYHNIIGRKYELNRLVDILSKMEKNNAVLIGNPGVGKTAIVYALAQLIVNGFVPAALSHCRILELNTSEIISGCKYRGDFEARITKMFADIERCNEEVILYLDEIHSMVGLGNAEGALDMSTMIKPFLLKSNVKIIGTSTYKEYRKLEADKALERRFDTITVDEPSFEEALKIMDGVKCRFEDHYKVHIPKKTLEAIISLSQRYIPERYLPDKAIDVLDESCSIKVNSIGKRHHSKTIEITPEDILVCISRKKMMPLDQVQTSCDLDDLENYLNSKIIGQQHVINILSKAIRRTQAGLNDENRPSASFLFIGPTGVGKTEVAKTLADLIFSGRNNIIKFDMSEYQEEHTVSKLIGAPPGYEGYKDAGLLTEQVRRHPYSLVLFDEIEKAHPKVFTLLLQVLDEGILTDSHGEHVNFKNTIIILTSNVGISNLSKSSVGFVEHLSSKTHDIMTAVKKTFQPEFLNRLDEIITFNWLSEDNVLKIAELCISTDVVSKLNKKGIHITISESVIRKIAKLGYNHEYGARELKRTITREIKNPLADFLIKNSDAKDISIKLDGDTLVITSDEAVMSV